MKLNDLMEFDHVIQVHEDGSITEPRGVYAPELHDGKLGMEVVDGVLRESRWTLMNGYSGQYRYSGPIMHSSEFIGGGMERDIRSTPGLYVALVDYPGDDSEPDGWAVAYREAS